MLWMEKAIHFVLSSKNVTVLLALQIVSISYSFFHLFSWVFIYCFNREYHWGQPFYYYLLQSVDSQALKVKTDSP